MDLSEHEHIPASAPGDLKQTFCVLQAAQSVKVFLVSNSLLIYAHDAPST